MNEKGIYDITDETTSGAVPGRRVRASYEFANFGDLLVLRDAYPYAADLARVAGMMDIWRDSAVAQGVDRTYLDKGTRSSESLLLSKKVAPILEIFENAMEFCVKGALRLYQIVNKFALVSGHSGFELLRYGIGGKFDEHVDVIPGHPQWGYRRVSVLIYLNEDYEGGELHFPRQSITFKPSAGSIVLFPSDFTYPHISAPVVSGTKYAAVTWFS